MLNRLIYLHVIAAFSGACLLFSCPATNTVTEKSGPNALNRPVGLYEAIPPANTKAEAAPAADDGMGYIVLSSAKSFQSQVTDRNTIYEIKGIFDLRESGGAATIPEGCILRFSGGIIKNGTIKGNNTVIDAPLYQIFDNCTLTGFNQPLHSRWWCVLDGRDNTVDLQNALNSVEFPGTLILDRGQHLVSNTLTIPDNCTQIVGDNENGMYPAAYISFGKTTGTCFYITRHASLNKYKRKIYGGQIRLLSRDNSS